MDSEVLNRNGRRSRAGSQGGSQSSSRRRDWRGSSSEDEAPRMDPHVFASLLAQAHQQYTGDHRSYRSDCEDGGPGGAPGPPRSPRSPQLRQSSPFPVENTNRRLLYGTAQDRLRQGNGEIIYATANPKKLPSSSSLSRSGRAVGRRSRGLTPSSSASSGLEGPALRGAEPYVLDQDPRLAGLCINHDPGEDSPPEPAPPEVPPRGPSLRRSGGQPIPPQALEAVPNCNFYNQEYIMAGSPRTESRAARSPVSVSNASSSQHRLTPSQLHGGMGTLGGGVGGGGGTLGVPTFPSRSHNSAPSCAPYSPSRFHIDKRCQHRCSWKCFSIAMILLAVVLAAMLTYFATLSSMKPNVDSSNCILVQDVKAVTHDQMTQDAMSTQSPTEESAATIVAEKAATTLSAPHLPQQQTQAQHWPPTLELRDFDVLHSATIPPFQFWNSEFRNKQPAFVRLNFTLPWGANFAVYGRRNVVPSITQYDFFEFIRGGRLDNRLRRRRRDISEAEDSDEDDSKSNESHSVNRNADHRQSAGNADVLDSILQSYEGTDRILADGDRRGPFYYFAPDKNVESSADNKEDLSEDFQPSEPRPTVDLQFTIDQHIISKRSASSENMYNISFIEYLDTGRWFLSVYNDELQSHNVELIVSEAEGVSNSCPNDCSGRGSCYLGKCDCIDGFQGTDCSKSVCPVLCSGHGQYGGGICHCEEGWKGPECDVPKEDCLPADCSGHGRCSEGSCRCSKGWKGEGCTEPDCPDPTCKGHGACVSGKCYCKAGWRGDDCGEVDHQVYKCLPGCSQHGTYDLDSGKCICDKHWTGADCSQPACGLDCGSHGSCTSGRCHCEAGWTGTHCEQRSCDERCSAHGQCKNGTCVCSQGWNGRHCTLPGCENGCSRHGQCSLEAGEYRCVCSKDWAGADCSLALEKQCDDGIDNDHDGITDCFDAECCSQVVCKESLMCLVSNEPADVLLRKQPPSVTASFYQRVKFIIEENSVQSYSHMSEYSERENIQITETNQSIDLDTKNPMRVSVMRGQVLTSQGLGIIGMRVSVDRNAKFGFTLTRPGGWFDVLVNGGGAVTLQFQRQPFQPLTKTLFVPWNQIVVLPPFYIPLTDEKQRSDPGILPNHHSGLGFPGLSTSIFSRGTEPCLAHDHELLSPKIAGTWASHTVGGQPGRSLVFAETQIVQESIPIPGSDLHLMYQSSQAAGYLSTVHMKLTHDFIPSTLTHVHVRVEIEGSLHVKTYEADPNLTHTFAWNKRNVYKQKVYGVALAKIFIGYQHKTCKEPVWETQTATLQGCDVDISDIGGWGLDIHHHYNFHEGILQKGDGSTLHLKQYPRTVKVIMGTGLQRNLSCPNHCNGEAKDAKLLSPVALASGPDGSLYVGDFNLIRRITPEGKIHTVLQLTDTQVSYQYYLCVSPADGHLYVSDPEKHQILRVLSLDDVSEPTINVEPVVGNGERCIPGDETNCGDESPAILAKLSHPKGLAIAADKTMYIADGTNIRAVDPNGIIHTIVGHHGRLNHWSPAPCIGAIPAHQAQLQWPTGLSLSPLDGSLHFIDDRLVLKLTPDMKVKVVAGKPLHCRSNTNNDVNEASDKNEHGNSTDLKSANILGTVLSLAFAPTGELYIAEADSRRTNLIKCVDTAGKITLFAGKQQEKVKNFVCECNTSSSTTSNPHIHENSDQIPIMNCPCLSNMFIDETTSNAETLLSSNAKFQTISALSVSPDGVLNIADQGSLHILALKHYLPNHDESGEFHIPYPPTSEIYVFNRYGQHVATKDLTSAKTRYSFLYSKNTSFGKLSTVTDASGNKIQFLRDYSNLVSSIENTQDHKSELKMSGVGFLTKLTEKGRSEIELDYDSNTGLLNSKSGGGETYMYVYDDLGRVTTVIVPTGEVINIGSGLSKNNGLMVEVSNPVKAIIFNDNQHKSELLLQGQNSKILNIKNEEEQIEAIIHSNDTLSVTTPWGGRLESSAVAKHPLLQAALPVEAEMLRMWSHQSTCFGDNIVNTMTSTYSLVGDVRNPQQTLNREIWVNNSKILAIEFDQFTSKQTFYDRDHHPLLVITFDTAGLPESFTPSNGAVPLKIFYDRFNRIDGWQWGRSEEKYKYDRHGLLSEIITSPENGTKTISYNDWNLISKITLASNRIFSLLYDDDGGLKHITLPSGTKHSFNVQPSLGFLRVTYTPPGSSRSYLQHYSHSGALLQTVYPGDGARIVYRYHGSGRLAEIVYGDGRTEIGYSKVTGMPSEVLHSERDMDYRWEFQYTGGLLTEERIDYGAKTGLSNAKFTYEYDSNYRLTSIQGRIGGQNLPPYNLAYSAKTGALEQIGQFKISKPQHNETHVFDGTAIFSHTVDERLLEKEITVTIHGMQVFKMEFSHDKHGRISQTRTYTKNLGINAYTNIKNYTWDSDGQLIAAENQEPWGFTYDDNGNMLSLTYKRNTIPMEYNAMDRIVKFGEGQYRYDSRGSVAQNTREERFQYNAKGLLIRATKRGRFDVRYYYDHLDRLATRKDNFGNVTQFFYNNQEKLHEVSQIYSPRDGKLMTLVYDDRGHLIYAQVYRHKYYFATDECGTPVMVFNQYGEGIREIMRSPYGHIIYDSYPYMYLPVDFCGGLLDQVTALVHMPNGKVYDPLIGQWMSPLWENIVDRVANPTQLNLYRFNGNDPINIKLAREKPTDHLSWLSRLGYNLKSLAPQLFPDDLPGGSVLPPVTKQPTIWGSYKNSWALQLPSLISNLPTMNVESGFVSFLSLRKMTDAKSLSAPPRSALKTNVMDLVPKKIGAASDPPFGKGILVSRTPQGQAIVSSVPAANAIYRDVYTSVFNRSYMLPFTFVVHNAQQDAFYFVKEETWRASEDKQQLKRMQGQVNTTFHEIPKENGSGNNYLDVKIHGLNAVINLRYGTTAEKEKQRLLHHARLTAVRKAWHREKDIVRNGFSGSIEWTASEIEEIQKQGFASNYEGEYVHNIQTYPELAEDPFNIRFIKKQRDQSKRKRRKRQSKMREKPQCSYVEGLTNQSIC